ncbi:MAG TPA: adenylyltransferase/cytidyltransferase family protein [Chthoniobacterales bacterium]|nr:adenylyltransferase/cytidyltransferase family protein [Chthoniobacterales bacterium]
MNSKILTLDQLAAESGRLRSQSQRVVATNGCFEILHVGHVRYLAAAQKLGDVLVVGLNGDDSVRQLKGEGRPVNREQDRAEVLAALESVDYVTIFPENRATNFLRAAAPAVYAKGGDYTADTLDPGERAVLDEFGSRIEIIPFEKGYSTSELLTRIGPK